MIVNFDNKIKFFVVQDNENSEPYVIERSDKFLKNIHKYIINMIFKHRDMAEKFVQEYKNEQNLIALKEVLCLNDDNLIEIKNVYNIKKEREKLKETVERTKKLIYDKNKDELEYIELEDDDLIEEEKPENVKHIEKEELDDWGKIEISKEEKEEVEKRRLRWFQKLRDKNVEDIDNDELEGIKIIYYYQLEVDNNKHIDKEEEELPEFEDL